MINYVGSDKNHLDTFYLGNTEKILGDIYLRKDDIVTLTAAEYKALATKTAPYYFITDV